MTVRRLAPDEVQPARFAFSREKRAEAKKWIAKYPRAARHRRSFRC